MDIVSWLLIVGIAAATNVAMLVLAGAFRRKLRRTILCDMCNPDNGEDFPDGPWAEGWKERSGEK